MASARRRNNSINQIKDPDGNTVSGQADVMGVIHRFFEQKWCSVHVSENGWPCLDSHAAILADATDRLVRDVTAEEVWEVVWELGPNRAPGRDGVMASFIKAYWSIVGDQVTAACLEFFSTGIMDPGWKDMVVILLPKVDHPIRPSNFRPISLCQTFYKIVAKILVNRMRGLLPSLISEEQAAFVPGRSISEHCLLGQEIMNKFKVAKSTMGWLALKVDMEQAYDKMSWRTLEVVLTRMGFPARFCSWVLGCICNPRFLVLVNGQLLETIVASCEFKKGCLLSPYLFILCSELLSLPFHQRFGELGVQIGAGGPLVSHLLYDDDVLFFAGATIPNVRKCLSILEDYCSWTGQRINKDKSAILFSRSTPSTTKSRLAKLAGCRKVEELEYLGIQFALRRLRKADFSPLLQKI
ncbi:putative mitochondrial protein [Dendrobium catenatum]|uniref:Putative mitochondrial protein n=1 Tax=Dendrobium catenatum TaxID=906689 RepID=A0A2I0VGS6_9ASPA|nr:putative mitochondrial protein [Dendrobium catenatum]